MKEIKNILADLIDILEQELDTKTNCRKDNIDVDCNHMCDILQRRKCIKAVALRDRLGNLKKRVEEEK